jgi:hypothetical protein
MNDFVNGKWSKNSPFVHGERWRERSRKIGLKSLKKGGEWVNGLP